MPDFRSRIAVLLQRAAHRTAGRHVYLSTGCLHGDHGYCQTEARRYDGTTKKPSVCKFCEAKCICRCHRSAP